MINKRKYSIYLTLLILIIIGSYFLIVQMKIGSETTLTKEQEELDKYLSGYYLAYSNKSVTRILSLFNDKAILSAPDGTICKDNNQIRSYYDRTFMAYKSFTIIKKILKIEIRGSDATAIYKVRVRPLTLAGDREPPQLFYRDSFVLTKQGDSWKITVLMIETSQAD